MTALNFTLPMAVPVPAIPKPAKDSHAEPPRLPRVEWVERTGSVLQPSIISTDGSIRSLNLTRGCVHQCAFCSVRASPGYTGDDVIQVYQKTAERLDKELSRSRQHPRAVFISPSTDPFPPVTAIQMETARVIAVLAKHGVDAWLMTRGYIRPTAFQALVKHRKHVRITVGMTTLDRKMQRILEPFAAPPHLRLEQIARLGEQGIAVQAAIQPLVPGLTDGREELLALLEALALKGIRHVTTSYMFLRSNIADHLVQRLKTLKLDKAVLDAFTNGPLLSSEGLAAARYLPKARRQRGYATVIALASALGITVSVDSTTNPDFTAPHANTSSATPRQRLLALWMEASQRQRAQI